MHLLKVDLSHQILLTEKFRELDLEISEYSFPNIYLFRQIHQHRLFYKKELFINGITRDGASYLMPTNRFIDHMTPEEMIADLNEVDFFYPIPEQWLDFFDPSIFSRTYNEEESDYIYIREKMLTFHGAHSNAKSNLVHQFLDNDTIELFPLDPDQIQPALSILEQWQLNKKLDISETDYVSCKEGIELINKLQLEGLIAYVNKTPVGFIIGERIGGNSYVVHFVKGDR